VEYNFVIDKIALRIPCVNIIPSLTPLLEMQTERLPATYEYEAIDMRQFSIPSGSIVRCYNRVYGGRLPRKILIGFFTESSFSGQRDQSPLLTAPLDLQQIGLSVNGVVVREMNMDFSKDIYVEAYRSFTDWMKVTTKNYPVTFHIFKNGMRYFAFDLLENCPSNGCSDDTLQQGFIDINLRFRTALATDCIMAAFCEAPEIVEITKERASRHIKVVL
jgi:hypothetical protein